MTAIRFQKLHGAENDFLLTWEHDTPATNLPEVARRICARTTGVGADGWMLVGRAEGGLRTRLFQFGRQRARDLGKRYALCCRFRPFERGCLTASGHHHHSCRP